MSREANTRPPIHDCAKSRTLAPAKAEKPPTPKRPLPARASQKPMSSWRCFADPLGQPDQLTAATGWLPHTTPAALTQLKKKGHFISKSKVEGVSRYTIASS